MSGVESEGDDDNVSLAPHNVSCKSAKWKTITGLAFIDSEKKVNSSRYKITKCEAYLWN